MNAAAWSLTTLLVNLSLSLLWTTLFATLRWSYLFAAEAGLERLPEKYPDRKHLLADWIPRWDVVRAALQGYWILGLISVAWLGFSLLAALGGTAHALWFWVGFAVLWLGAWWAADLLPRVLARAYADRICVRSLGPLRFLIRMLWPLPWFWAWLERGALAMLLRHAGEAHRPSHEDAIRTLISRSAPAELDEEEKEILRSVFEFGETVAREIMTPRVDVVGVPDDVTVAECVARLNQTSFSRFPVYHESLDDVRGLVHVKHLLRLLSEDQGQQRITVAVKSVPFVPESMPIDDVLRLLRAEQAQAALVVDEYGGTAGWVTMEDIIEELVGEIHDEYDTAERQIHRLSDGAYVINARLLVADANERLDLNLPEGDEYDSLGGYVIQALGRIPRPGDTFAAPGCDLTVQTATPRQILTLRLHKKPASGGNLTAPDHVVPH